MDIKETCYDCGNKGPDCGFYSCNVCDIDVCRDCLKHHYPAPEVICSACSVVIHRGELCVQDLTCPYCSNSIYPPICETCPDPHLVSGGIFVCSSCGKEGCSDSVRTCGFSSEGAMCDRNICFDCGIGCIEECDSVRCCFEHAEKCRECGCADQVRCGQCQRQMENDKEPKCIDCISGFHLAKCRGDELKYDYEWISEGDGKGHWNITPKTVVSKLAKRHRLEEVSSKKTPGFWDYDDLSEFDYVACDD